MRQGAGAFPRCRARCAAVLLAALSLAGAAGAESVSFSADSVQSSLAKGRERTILEGRAKVRTGSISIEADRVELFGKDFVFLQCSGKVVVVDTERQIRLESPNLYYDRDKKLSRAQGPSILEDERNKLVLKAEWIENDGGNEVTMAQVAVRILKDKLACRAEYALYRRKDNELELTGAPSAYKDGDEYKAARILVNTETEDIHLEGEVSGSVSDKASGDNSSPEAEASDKKDESGGKAPGKASPAPKPADGQDAPGTPK
jgi:lipopolysaccharide export system protein LptA